MESFLGGTYLYFEYFRINRLTFPQIALKVFLLKNTANL